MTHFAFASVVIALLCVCQVGQASVRVELDVDVTLDQRDKERKEEAQKNPIVDEREGKDGVVSLKLQSPAHLLQKYSLDEDRSKPKEKTSSPRDDVVQLSSMVHQILSLALKMEDRVDSLERAVESVSSETETKVRAYLDVKAVEISHQQTAFEETIEKRLKRVEETLGLKIETFRDQLTSELKDVMNLHKRDEVETGNDSFCNITEKNNELIKNTLSLFKEPLGLYRESFMDELNSTTASLYRFIRAQTQIVQSTLDNKVSNAMLELSALIDSTLKKNQATKDIEHPDVVNVSCSSDTNGSQEVNVSPVAGDQSNTDFPEPIACRKDAVDPAISNVSTYVVIPKSDSGDVGSAYLCDQVTDGGGWIVIQHRINTNGGFFKNWKEYKNGFGDLSGDFWLGNDLIHNITASGEFELRVELSKSGIQQYAHYNHFFIDDESNGYSLDVSGYSGTAGDSLSPHKGYRFSTWDKDTDADCAYRYLGAWWYRYDYCYQSTLNSSFKGPHWNTSFKGFSGKIETTVMKIRRAA